MANITVREDTCTRCGACVAVCISGEVYQLGETAAEVVHPDNCWLCGHCVAVCPVDAILHSDHPLDECPVTEPLPSYEEMVAAMRERRSLRAFRDKPVPRETVRQLVDISRWAPNASNSQLVDWIAIDDPAQIARLSAEVAVTLGKTAQLLRNRLLRPLLYLVYGVDKIDEAVEGAEDFHRVSLEHARGVDPIFYHAPMVLAAHVPQRAYFGRDDAVYAAYNLMLGAQRLGLGTCHIGYFNIAVERNKKLLHTLGLPPERKLEVVLILGYPRFKFRRGVTRRFMELVWNPQG